MNFCYTAPFTGVTPRVPAGSNGADHAFVKPPECHHSITHPSRTARQLTWKSSHKKKDHPSSKPKTGTFFIQLFIIQKTKGNHQKRKTESRNPS